MLRDIVLFAGFGIAFAAGVGVTLTTTHAKRQSLAARLAALETRELFLDAVVDQHRRGAFLEPSSTLGHRGGRHRLEERRVRSLATATLTEATAILATRIAERVQQRRHFVDIMTQAGASQFARAVARV